SFRPRNRSGSPVRRSRGRRCPCTPRRWRTARSRATTHTERTGSRPRSWLLLRNDQHDLARSAVVLDATVDVLGVRAAAAVAPVDALGVDRVTHAYPHPSIAPVT